MAMTITPKKEETMALIAAMRKHLEAEGYKDEDIEDIVRGLLAE